MSKPQAGLSTQETIQKHPLQAIILADAWGEELRWGPLVRGDRSDYDDEDSEDGEGTTVEERPWCLLPLLNIPLLSWTLECLAASGVEEAFIFIREGSEQVKEYLSTSPFTLPTSSLSITLRPTQSTTPGDILREVDSLGILAPVDFLVVQAGYVGNVNLSEKVREFKERRERETSLSMCCLVSGRGEPTSSTFAVHVLSPDSQLYHYEESKFFPKLKFANLPRDAFGPKDITVRADLESIGVAICNVEVPALFTENFDYQFFYPDFVNGILTSDLLGKTICCNIIDEPTPLSLSLPPPSTTTSLPPPTTNIPSSSGGRKNINWAAAVNNTKSYEFISKSILSRKIFPITPDENLPYHKYDGTDGEVRYEHRGKGIYYGIELDLSRTCSILSSTLIGPHTLIGDKSIISHSILSPDVTIGKNCTITNSHLFRGVTIKDNSIIINSILGENVEVGEGSKLTAGTLVGRGTILGAGARLRNEWVSSGKWKGDGEVGVEARDRSLGENHKAFFWPNDNAIGGGNVDDTDDEDDTLDPRNLSMTTIGAKLNSLYLSDDDSSATSNLSRKSSMDSLNSNSNDEDSETDSDSDDEPPAIAGISQLTSSISPETEFLSECKQSLDRSFLEDHTVENAVIEMKTLRMASNMPLSLVRNFVIPYVLGKCDGSKNVKKVIERWGGLVSSLTGSEESEMASALFIAQKFIAESEVPSIRGDLKFFSLVLRGFYEQDVVTEEAVLAWYKSKEARMLGGEGKKLWEGAKPFVEALMAEDESDEDESE